MVRWGDYIKRTVVRRVVWIVVGLLVYGLLSLASEAHAHVGGGHAGREEAYEHCDGHPLNLDDNPNYQPLERRCVLASDGKSYRLEARNHNTGNWSWFGDWFGWPGPDCPGGSLWRDDVKACFDDDTCRNRNDNLLSGNAVYSFSTNVCLDGCSFGPTLPKSCSSVVGEPGQLCAARYEYTGAQCYADPPDDPPTPEDPPDEDCIWFGGEAGSDGKAFCKKDDGRECYTIQGGSRAGQRTCWNPGETGRKFAGDTAVTRGPGPNEPPAPDPPPGESMEKVGDSVTTETTNTSPSGSSSSTTTTRQDRTMYGTDAGGPGSKDDSEPPGDGTPGDGDGDEDDGDISGGSDCSAPPVCTGDRLMCGLNEGLWRIRCDGSGDSATLIGDTITDIDGAIAEGEGDGDPDDTDMLEHADPDTWREIEQVNADDLDDTGFGLDRSCPVLPAVQVGPANMQFDLTPICTFLSWMSGLVLALAYFIAARIIAGVK